MEFMERLLQFIKQLSNNDDNGIRNEVISSNEDLDKFICELKEVYNDVSLRINSSRWEYLIKTTSINLSIEDMETGMMKFLMENYSLPYDIWVSLNKFFNWTSRMDCLMEVYPQKFLEFVLACVNGKYKLRHELNSKSINEQYEKLINIYYETSFAIETKDLDNARRLIDEGKNIFSENLDFLILEAKYYCEVGNPTKAIKILCYASSLNNKDLEIYLEKARIYIMIGEIKEAYETYYKCLVLAPDDVRIQHYLASCCSELQKYEEAKELYQIILEKYPLDKVAERELENVNNSIKERLEDKIREGKDQYSDKMDLAEVYFYFSMYEKCYEMIKYIEQVITPSAKFYLFIAEVLKQLGKSNDSSMYYNKALELKQYN